MVFDQHAQPQNLATIVEALTFVFRKLRGFLLAVYRNMRDCALFSHVQKIFFDAAR